MSKELHINTILAQAGIKSDEATGALVTPLHFSTTYQHPCLLYTSNTVSILIILSIVNRKS